MPQRWDLSDLGRLLVREGACSPSDTTLPPVTAKPKRRAIIVEGFQTQLVVTLVVWAGALLLVFAALLIGPLVWQLTRSTPSSREVELAAALLHLHERLWLPLAALFLGLGFVFMRVTHRVAGPLYRFRQVFARVESGDLTMRVRIREDDYLHQECRDLNAMIGGLRERACQAKASIAALRRELEDRAGASGALRVPGAMVPLLARVDEADRALAAFVTETPTTAGTAVAERTTVDAGFSLIELMIVICTISTLAGLAIPGYQAALNRARVARAIGDVNAVGKDLTMYRVSQGCFPGTLSAIGRDALRDPWGNLYGYGVPQRPGRGGRGGGTGSCEACGGACITAGAARKDKNLVPINSDFDLYSKGRDGKTASALTAGPSKDDIIRGRDGGFIGLASEY